jgi:phosphinothricin acetyltransferase
MPVEIRPSRDEDVPAIAAIYAHRVPHGTASFEIDPPAEDEMRRRRAAILSHGLPYPAAVRDGTPMGYAYAGPYRPRAAYRDTVENSIYIHPDSIGHGIGGRLLPVPVAA